MVSRSPVVNSMKTTLLRMGNLHINYLPSVPDEFSSLVDRSVVVGASTTYEPANPTPAFTHPDVAFSALSGYDELVVDVGIVVASDGNVSSNVNKEVWRHLDGAGIPFWAVIRCDGYNRPSLRTRDTALAIAKSVMQSISGDVKTYRLEQKFLGFAFISPDLNVLFPDATVIDRLFQSSLVQYAHELLVGACFVTSRPNDIVAMVAPTIANDLDTDMPNSNSGKALEYPIIGCFPQFNDKIILAYPNVAATVVNPSLVIGQLTSAFGYRVRDGGFSPSIEWCYAIPADYAGTTSDGITGANTSESVVKRLSDVIAFLGAAGITSVALQSGPALNFVHDVVNLLPPSSLVNYKGASAITSANGTISVRYSDVIRRFNASLEEIKA